MTEWEKDEKVIGILIEVKKASTLDSIRRAIERTKKRLKDLVKSLECKKELPELLFYIYWNSALRIMEVHAESLEKNTPLEDLLITLMARISDDLRQMALEVRQSGTKRHEEGA